MLTVKNGDYDNYYYYDERVKSVDAMNRIENIISKTEIEVKDLQYKLKIFKSELMDVYKSNVSYMTFDWLLKPAQKWSIALQSGELNGEKIDRRKKYDEKSLYEMLKDQMGKYLGVEVNITSIITYALHTEAYIIEFEYGNNTFQLFIPVIKNVTMESVDYSGAKFCFSLHVSIKTGSHCWNTLFYTYEEEELGELFKKYLEDNNL